MCNFAPLSYLVMRSIVNIESYFRDRVRELKSLAERGDPWVFLCASSFIEYLAKIRLGRETTQTDYKNFLNDCFFKLCPKYASFRYDSGQSDLAEQMYHVLRCGIVHSFSLIPDPNTRKRHGGRDRSILLAHRRSGLQHLQNYVDNDSEPKLDAAIFIAEDFVEDIAKVTEFILVEATRTTNSGRDLKSKIQNWVRTYPPIAGLKETKPPDAADRQSNNFGFTPTPSG